MVAGLRRRAAMPRSINAAPRQAVKAVAHGAPVSTNTRPVHDAAQTPKTAGRIVRMSIGPTPIMGNARTARTLTAISISFN